MSAAEDEAKAAWLAKLDAPAWGQAAEAMSTIVAEANQFQKLNDECDAGDSAACDTLSKEDQAKAAWLAKIDVPSWGAAAAAMKEIGEEQLAEPMANVSEEEAKKAWLAKLDAPVWGQAAAAMTSIAAEANLMAGDVDASAAEALARENEAKKAWLAKLDVPSWGTMSEETAKNKWLAKLNDVPSWHGKVATSAPMEREPAVFRMEVSEEEAKKKWLAKLDDVPSWTGKVAPTAQVAVPH